MASSYKYLIGIFFVPFFQKFINYQMSWKMKLLDPQKWWTHRLVPMSHAKNILLLFLHNAPISAGSGISDLGFGFLNCHGELGFSFFIFCQSFLSYICKITNIGDFFFVEIILWIFEKFPNKNLSKDETNWIFEDQTIGNNWEKAIFNLLWISFL